MLLTLRTYRWIPGLMAALLMMSTALPLLAMACLGCAMPGEEAGMHAEAMPCPEMAHAETMPLLGKACDMAPAVGDCCTMQAQTPAQKPRARAETTPRLFVLLHAMVAFDVARLEVPPPVFLPPEAAVPLASSISIPFLISSLRN